MPPRTRNSNSTLNFKVTKDVGNSTTKPGAGSSSTSQKDPAPGNTQTSDHSQELDDRVLSRYVKLLETEVKESQSAEMKLFDAEKRIQALEAQIEDLKKNRDTAPEAATPANNDVKSEDGSVGDASALRSLSPSAMKRKVEDELYERTPVKKMRPAEALSPSSLSGGDNKGVRQYLTAMHKEILRTAGAGGLIDPRHFSITEAGTISITRLGLQRAKTGERAQSDGNSLDYEVDERSAQLSSQIRVIMEDHDFFEQGHPSLRPLVEGLKDGYHMHIRDLVRYVKEVELHTKGSVFELDDQTLRLELMESNQLSIMRPNVRRLYQRYDTGCLSHELQDFFTRPRHYWEEALTMGNHITFGYFGLYSCVKDIDLDDLDE